jgi:hypothetical protein
VLGTLAKYFDSEVIPVFCKFVLLRNSLKFGNVTRTPEMQTGIFDSSLTSREALSWTDSGTNRNLMTEEPYFLRGGSTPANGTGQYLIPP